MLPYKCRGVFSSEISGLADEQNLDANLATVNKIKMKWLYREQKHTFIEQWELGIAAHQGP